MKTTGARLTDEELILLDALCRPEIQAEVDAAKVRLSFVISADLPVKFHDFARRLIELAHKEQQLTFEPRSIRHCSVCDRWAGYKTYRRNSKYHRKGEIDTSKPLYLRGVDFGHSFVVGNTVCGLCGECYAEFKPFLAALVAPLEIELTGKLEQESGVTSRYKRYGLMVCTKCGWQGHEGLMLLTDAVFGGKYPGVCPSCGAKNIAFGPTVIKREGGYALVAIDVAVSSEPEQI